jgi:hypothetical protein
VVAEVLEDQQLYIGGLVLEGVQTASTSRQEEEQDASKDLLADVGVLWLFNFRRTSLSSSMTGSNGVIFCWCWQEMLPTL